MKWEEFLSYLIFHKQESEVGGSMYSSREYKLVYQRRQKSAASGHGEIAFQFQFLEWIYMLDIA